MSGKYELYSDQSSGFRFRLKASNGDIVMTSESYKTKASAEQGLERAQRTATTTRVVDLTAAVSE
ncbi:YegP family protein [Pseudarthrobacter sp. NPDC058196]|uniref:YegP family protein n=1 Tax=Pseudarthrobacter sp. NPDC058196 TaxID=3346376 RepID=UPI0036D913C7